MSLNPLLNHTTIMTFRPSYHLRFWFATILGLFFDRLTKDWVLATFSEGESWHLWPGVFHFTFVLNPGAAFSLFQYQGEWLRWMSLGVSVVLTTWALRDPLS